MVHTGEQMFIFNMTYGKLEIEWIPGLVSDDDDDEWMNISEVHTMHSAEPQEGEGDDGGDDDGDDDDDEWMKISEVHSA